MNTTKKEKIIDCRREIHRIHPHHMNFPSWKRKWERMWICRPTYKGEAENFLFLIMLKTFEDLRTFGLCECLFKCKNGLLNPSYQISIKNYALKKRLNVLNFNYLRCDRNFPVECPAKKMSTFYVHTVLVKFVTSTYLIHRSSESGTWFKRWLRPEMSTIELDKNYTAEYLPQRFRILAVTGFTFRLIGARAAR